MLRQLWRLKYTNLLFFFNQECIHLEKAGCRNERRRQWSEGFVKHLNWVVLKFSWAPRPCWPKSISVSTLYSGIDNLIFAWMTWNYISVHKIVIIYSLGLVENYIRHEGGGILEEKYIQRKECLWKLRVGEAKIRVWECWNDETLWQICCIGFLIWSSSRK